VLWSDGGLPPGAGLHHDVDLEALGVAVVEQARREPPVSLRLVDLGGHPALEHLAAKGVVAKLIRRGGAQEVADQPGVEEVELRCIASPGRGCG
jgi:hypothetical protein